MKDDQLSSATAVIGLGNMGSALAFALLADGHQVTVWNRTLSKADPLVNKGARVAGSVAEAVQSADLTIICVAEHSVIKELTQTDAVENAIKGHGFAQLGVVTAEQAKDVADWAKRHDVRYLEGSILGVPDQIASKAASIVCSGSAETFANFEPVLEAFGTPVHISEEIGAAYQFDKVTYPFGYGASLGFVQGAAMAHAAGYSVSAYTTIVLEWLKSLDGRLRNFGRLIEEGDFQAYQAELNAWTAGCEKALGLCRELGVDDTLPEAHLKMLRRGIEKGYGEEEIIAVYKALLPKTLSR